MFDRPVFPSREPVSAYDLEKFRSRIKRAMSAAIRDGHHDRRRLSASMTRMLGASFSKTMLDAYTSEAKTGHDISLIRFKAFVRAVDAPQLWDVAVRDDGLLVLQGDEARLAEIARLQQEQKAIGDQLKRLKAVPVHIRRARPTGEAAE